MGGTEYTMVDSTHAVIDSDIPLFYPNPLYGNESFIEYGGYLKYYEAVGA
jgi:hypothetical protein